MKNHQELWLLEQKKMKKDDFKIGDLLRVKSETYVCRFSTIEIVRNTFNKTTAKTIKNGDIYIFLGYWAPENSYGCSIKLFAISNNKIEYLLTNLNINDLETFQVL